MGDFLAIAGIFIVLSLLPALCAWLVSAALRKKLLRNGNSNAKIIAGFVFVVCFGLLMFTECYFIATNLDFGRA